MAESFAHYTLLEALGCGALGPLQRARDTRTGRTVALRLLSGPVDAIAQQPLVAALRSALPLSHPSLATLFDVGEYDGAAYYAQEFVPGTSLAALCEGTALNPRRAIHIAIEVADALAEAAASGLEHGRLDASQIIVNPKGRAKVLDVGFAALAGSIAEHEPDTAALGRILESMMRGAARDGHRRDVPPAVAPIVARAASGGYESPVLLAADLREASEALEAKAMEPMVSRPQNTSAAPSLWWGAAFVVVTAAAVLIWFALRS